MLQLVNQYPQNVLIWLYTLELLDNIVISMSCSEGNKTRKAFRAYYFFT